MESLCGAVFRGHLAPPDGESHDIKYEFSNALSSGPLPQAVKRQRQAMRWPWKQDVLCIDAVVSMPSLGLDAEEVLVSSDPPQKDGCLRLLLQSLKRPELGVTVLVLQPGGDELHGGEEDWEPGNTPLIRVSRGAPSPSSSPKGKQVSKPSKPQGPPTGARRPQLPVGKENRSVTIKEAAEDLTRPPIVAVPPGPRIYEDPHDSDTEQEQRRDELALVNAGPLSAVSGGIGRSAMDFGGKPPPARQQAPTPGAGYNLMRPDMVVGDPDKTGTLTDDDLRAAEADTVERLVAAASRGETGDMRILLARIGPNHISPPDSKHAGLSPLMVAAEKGRDESLDLLLEKKAELDYADRNGWTALMYAVSGQRQSTVKRLLDARSSVNVAGITDEKYTPLMLAASGARHELCTALLKAGANKEAQDTTGRRAVHLAAKAGRNAQLTQLLAAKARIDEVDNEGRTPLLTAATSGRDGSVKILLGARANIAVTDPEGRSARDLAGVFAHERVLNALNEVEEERASRGRG